MIVWKHLPTLIEQSLNSGKALPSGLTSSSRNRSRYVFGCRRWNVATLIASEGVEEAAIPQATDHARDCKSKPFRSCQCQVERGIGNFRSYPFSTPMTLRLGTRQLSRAFRQQSQRYRSHSTQQLPGDYSVVLPKEPFVWGVSHIIPRAVPVHIPRPPYVKGDRPILDDPDNGDPYEGDGRIVLGSSEEKSLRGAALLARDALSYASTLAKVITSSLIRRGYLFGADSL